MSLVVRPLSHFSRSTLLTFREPLEQFVALADKVVGGQKLMPAWYEWCKATNKRYHKADRPGIHINKRLRPLLEQVFGSAPDLWARDEQGRNTVVWVSDYGKELMKMAKPLLRELRDEAQALRG